MSRVRSDLRARICQRWALGPDPYPEAAGVRASAALGIESVSMGLEARGLGSWPPQPAPWDPWARGPRGFGLSRFPNPRGGCWAEPSGDVGWGFELAAVPEGSCPSPPSPGPAVTAPHSPAGSKESLFSCTLTASEEAMAVLEEVILYAFQQCVYYVSKVQPLRVRSPGGPGCRPGRLCPPGPRPRAPGPLLSLIHI